MAILALQPNNKNQYRKYPLKQGSTFQSSDGYLVPDDLIVNCSLTSIYGKHRIYIKQIYYKDPVVRIVIASLLSDEALGVFSGNVTENFTTLKLVPFTRNVSGNLTIGSLASLKDISRILNFDNNDGEVTSELEESVIFCYTPPAVTSIQDKKKNELRGIVEFGTLTNLTKTTDNPDKQTAFTALYPSAVFNLADKSSFLNNCKTPIIKNINGVVPSPSGVGEAKNDNNIYIAGVKPIVFYGLPGDNGESVPGTIRVSSGGITLDSLCTQKHKLLPPVDISGFTLNTTEFKNKYYSKPALPAYPDGSANYPLSRPARLASNFNATAKPEYYYWPQFVKPEYYNFWNTQQ
jgi:hypothetical protein